ncbi:MAG TPA: hypothetical protein PKB10_14645, partial [Tepidisphaeraceae bacterium]|nr:hypothetical protein [Tepidisphaeraceae bacterium]
PIVRPGIFPWRQCVVFNPAVVRSDTGTFYMLERAAGKLTPFVSVLGLLRSDDGIHFEHVRDQPVFTAAQIGFPHGGIQDPRVVRIDGRYVMTYVLRHTCGDCVPTGISSPIYRYVNPDNGRVVDASPKPSRTGIAVSDDLERWKHLAWVGPEDVDDRDNILFPEKIGGRYAMLRRPLDRFGDAYGCTGPGIWLSFSDDLVHWGPMTLIAGPVEDWEGRKIGGSATPIRTPRGWLHIYHGVNADWEYCAGLLLLDADDPTRVLARSKRPVMVPELYYERVGLVIPKTIFPNSNVVVDGTLLMYYGCCDTSIGLATANLDQLVDDLLAGRL